MRDPSCSPLTIIYQPISALRRNSRNARTHSKHQIRQIAASIKSFGFNNPILIDRDKTIVAGHGRVEAAKLVGIEQVPTILLDDLTEDQIRAYILADNRLAEKAGWDKEILAIELQYLLNIEEFDVTITGFEIPEIDLVLQDGKAKADDTGDNFEIVDSAEVTTQPGDIWRLGGIGSCAVVQYRNRLLNNCWEADVRMLSSPIRLTTSISREMSVVRAQFTTMNFPWLPAK